MVRPERFELPTCCSGGNRSIQLSYGRIAPDYTSCAREGRKYHDSRGPVVLRYLQCAAGFVRSMVPPEVQLAFVSL